MRIRHMIVLAALLLGLGAGASVADVGPTSEAVDPVTGDETNQVSCDGDAGDATLDTGDADDGIRVTAGGDGAAGEGYIVVCNDGSTAPVQGRIYGEGSATSSSGQACADGDADNASAHDSATGWACIGGSEAGPALACSQDGGTTNSENWAQNGLQPETCDPAS